MGAGGAGGKVRGGCLAGGRLGCDGWSERLERGFKWSRVVQTAATERAAHLPAGGLLLVAFPGAPDPCTSLAQMIIKLWNRARADLSPCRVSAPQPPPPPLALHDGPFRTWLQAAYASTGCNYHFAPAAATNSSPPGLASLVRSTSPLEAVGAMWRAACCTRGRTAWMPRCAGASCARSTASSLRSWCSRQLWQQWSLPTVMCATSCSRTGASR